MNPDLAVALEYVSDLIDMTVADAPRTITDPATAGDLLLAFLRRRVRAVCESRPGHPAVMLSGGIDSVVTAAVAVELGYSPLAVTVVTEGAADEPRATEAADRLALEHAVVRLDGDAVSTLAAAAMDALECDELWEVTAGVTFLAVAQELRERNISGAVLIGGGADAILAGGWAPTFPVSSEAALREFDAFVREDCATVFRRDRLIPDFYERLLGRDADRYIQVFQSVAAWRIAERLAPPALWRKRNGRLWDKACLRLAAERLGLPEELAWAPKDPMQLSSGIVASLVDVARQRAGSFPGATTYSDPATEPLEQVLVRFLLREFVDRLGKRP